MSIIFVHLQEVSDARRIRNQILSNFELSLQPGISGEESERLLHTVIVGGGPTGVEFGAELYDFVEQVTLAYLCIGIADSNTAENIKQIAINLNLHCRMYLACTKTNPKKCE